MEASRIDVAQHRRALGVSVALSEAEVDWRAVLDSVDSAPAQRDAQGVAGESPSVGYLG